MAIGKTLRFEVFARDGFTCQYCGQRPPDVVLELDHIHPRAKGGTDDPINLITSCFDCNRGKRDKILADIPKRPDADIEFLRVQQETAEVKRFLDAKAHRDKLIVKMCSALQETWGEYLTESVPTKRVLLPWITRYGAESVENAIHSATIAYTAGKLGFDDDRAFTRCVKYVGGILRNHEGEE